MKPNQIVQTYADPMEERYPIGLVQLIEFVREYGELECWKVHYVNGPLNECNILIKKRIPKGLLTNAVYLDGTP